MLIFHVFTTVPAIAPVRFQRARHLRRAGGTRVAKDGQPFKLDHRIGTQRHVDVMTSFGLERSLRAMCNRLDVLESQSRGC